MSALTSASGRPLAALRVSPAGWLALFTLATLSLRLIASDVAPLTEDEAYYRLWSLRPALGYYDHPPMIAWWIWLGRMLAGDDPLGVRLIPSLGAAATTLLTYALARQAGLAERIALRAAVWLNATLLIGLGGELAVPDGPNTLFWTAAAWFALKALNGRGAWWLAAGTAAGLACLSKYSALFLAPGVLLWLALSADGRRSLRTPWPWLAAAIALALFAPNVMWNAQHQWVTFAKQFGRVAAGGFDPAYLAKLLVDQFLLLNPLIAVFVGLAIWRRCAWPLLAIGAPFALYLVIHSLHGEVQGQWPSPLYPSLAVAAAAAAETATGAWAVLRRAATWIGLLAAVAILAFMIAPVGVRLPFRDPGRDVRGWPTFLAQLEQIRMAQGASWIGTPTYGLASQLAAAPPIHAPATEIFERQRYTFETPAERADFTRPGLIVTDHAHGHGVGLDLCFGQVVHLADLVRGAGAGATAYSVFLVAEPRRDIERAGCDRPPAPAA